LEINLKKLRDNLYWSWLCKVMKQQKK
jgi:hypothetical protein